MLGDFTRYHDWSMARIFQLADGLTDAALDTVYPIGFGSLRATLFHLVAAERLWLKRWQGRPWEPLDSSSEGVALSTMKSCWSQVAADRNAWLKQQDHAAPVAPTIHYQNSQGEDFQHRLWDLRLHVINHGIHHRAQALNMLRHQDRRATGGLDFLFYRIAYPTIDLLPKTAEVAREMGLEVAAAHANPPEFRRSELQRYVAYGDWAMTRALELASDLHASDLDRPFEMGVGSLRKTLLHIADAESWWYRNWTAGPSAFQELPETTELASLSDIWTEIRQGRHAWLDEVSDPDLAAPVAGIVLGHEFHFRIGETLLQLCGHGTHHRAGAEYVASVGSQPQTAGLRGLAP